MITLKDWLETVNYRVTEGSTWSKNCFSPNTYTLTYWNGDHDGHSFNIAFDTKTQEVYCVEAHDYARELAYRMINPLYQEAHRRDVRNKGEWADKAWDEVGYIDLDVDEDWLEKAQAIAAGQDYDTRVQMQVNFTDEELLRYMTLAHERDITFNQLIEQALREAMVRHNIPTLSESV